MSIRLSRLSSKEGLPIGGAGVSPNRLLKERCDLASDTREPREFQLKGDAAALDAGACAERALPECADAPTGPAVLEAGEVFDRTRTHGRRRRGVVQERIDRACVGVPMARDGPGH